MYLLVGLGNKGKEYAMTRHNIGFMVIDSMKELFFKDCETSSKETKKSHYSLVSFENKKIILLKPQTYMNLSGESVLEMMSYFKIQKENIVVIVDDYDLPFGDLRIRTKGSAGTHNGLKSIEQCIGPDYARIRCGIYSETKSPIDHFVIEPFSEDEKVKLSAFTKFVGEATFEILRNGISSAMNRYNKKNFLNL